MITYWFALTLFIPGGPLEKVVYSGYKSEAECYVAVREETEKAIVLLSKHKLIAFHLRQCTPSKPLAG